MSDEIDLEAARDNIIEALGEAFPSFKTIEAEDEKQSQFALPAILVQLSEIEPDLDADPHTGQFPCLIRFEARILIGHRTPKNRITIARAAGRVAVVVHHNRFGIPWGAARVLAVEPDEFAPVAEQYEVWRVEWVHPVDLGPSVFIDDGQIPSMLLTSWSPQIGEEHEDDYQEEDLG